MDIFKSFEAQLYDINDLSFEDIALSLFRYQAANNPIYRQYIAILDIDIDSVRTLESIPFLPISFFKRHKVMTGSWNAEAEFASSGTTASEPSKHFIKSLQFYLNHSKRCFEYFYGPLTDYHIFAMLPSYLERNDSSLVAMVDYFIKETSSPYSGFYLNNTDDLLRDILVPKDDGRKTLLWGVTFALVDVAEKYQPDLSHCLIIETGGMKGKKKELTRTELHSILKEKFRVREVFSEYGMTELLSQAYSKGDSSFFCPPYMRVLVRDLSDPFDIGLSSAGGINVVDLANFHSVAFIETEDLGRKSADGSFEVMGRIDNSEVRGCNLMVN